MIKEDHPFEFLNQLLFSRQNMRLQFSKYVYKEDSLFDERVIVNVQTNDLDKKKVEKLITGLSDNEELALHSRVVVGGRTYHIPMIDFAALDALEEEDLNRLSYFIMKPIYREMEFYSSGRSFHAYSTRLLSPKEWLEFNGRLLLVDIDDKKRIIDTRWVGHRIISGYSSLRWSCNTKQHSEYPKRLGTYKITNCLEFGSKKVMSQGFKF